MHIGPDDSLVLNSEPIASERGVRVLDDLWGEICVGDVESLGDLSAISLYARKLAKNSRFGIWSHRRVGRHIPWREAAWLGGLLMPH